MRQVNLRKTRIQRQKCPKKATRASSGDIVQKYHGTAWRCSGVRRTYSVSLLSRLEYPAIAMLVGRTTMHAPSEKTAPTVPITGTPSLSSTLRTCSIRPGEALALGTTRTDCPSRKSTISFSFIGTSPCCEPFKRYHASCWRQTSTSFL